MIPGSHLKPKKAVRTYENWSSGESGKLEGMQLWRYEPQPRRTKPFEFKIA